MKLYSKGNLFDYELKDRLFFYPSRELYFRKKESPYFTERLSFEWEKFEDSFLLKQKSPIYVNLVCSAEEFLGGIPRMNCCPPIPFSNGDFSGVVASSDGEKLLITARCEHLFYFEAVCDYVHIYKDSTGISQWSAENPVFLSHKYSEKEMADSLSEAFKSLNRLVDSPLPVYLVKVERKPTMEDVAKKRYYTFDRPMGYDWFDDKTYYLKDIPEWGINSKKIELECLLSSSRIEKSISFKIDNGDYKRTNIISDRDGGWFVYYRKDEIKGTKKFRTIYDMEEYLDKIVNRSDAKYIIPNKELSPLDSPLNYSATVHINYSIKDFFSEIGIDDFCAIGHEYRDNVGLTDI